MISRADQKDKSPLEVAVGSLAKTLGAKRKEDQTLRVAFGSFRYLAGILNKRDPDIGVALDIKSRIPRRPLPNHSLKTPHRACQARMKHKIYYQPH